MSDSTPDTLNPGEPKEPATPAESAATPAAPAGRTSVPSIYRSLASQKTGLRSLRAMTVMADHLAAPLEAPVTPALAESPDVLAARTVRMGKILMLFLFGVCGVWAASWPLASGAIAPGKVVLDSSRKTIQHLEGGIVKDLLVKEGQKVQEGEVLVRLDSTTATARRDVQRGQYIAAKAAEARLLAERDDAATVTFPEELLTLEPTDAQVREQLDTQRRLFDTRKRNLGEQIDVLTQRIGQGEDEISGLKQQAAAASEQLRLLKDEIGMVQALVASGNAVKSRLLALQRSAARLQGQRGEALANISRVSQQINESRITITNQKTEFLNQVMAELKDTQGEVANLTEQLRASDDVVRRIEIKAPLAGQVVGLAVHTVGGVVAPGEKMMDIVPSDDKLVIEAQVSPQDIDAVHEGLEARVRLTAYKHRRVPPVTGILKTVSADRFDEAQTGRAYYTAKIEIPASEFAELDNVSLTPGMPAEVLIVTGSRTVLSYLFDPVSHSFGRAFREE